MMQCKSCVWYQSEIEDGPNDEMLQQDFGRCHELNCKTVETNVCPEWEGGDTSPKLEKVNDDG